MSKTRYTESMRKLIFYTGLHFLIDLACIYFLTGMMIPGSAGHEQWLLLAVFYNLLAFAWPAVWGIMDDLIKKDNLLIILGFVLILMGYLCYRMPYIAILFLGTGNGWFHIGAGRQILIESDSKYFPSGVFISSGALGVYLGSCWGRAYIPLHKIFLIVLGIVIIFLWITERLQIKFLQQTDFYQPESTQTTFGNMRKKTFPFVLLFLVVFIRSYYGMILNYPWKTDFLIGLLFALCIMGGKMAGGFLADWAGIERSVILSLSAAAILAFFSWKSPICGCLSVFFFNMTMPLTLMRMFMLFPRTPGFAFGILMFALFLGTLPTMVWNKNWMFTPAGLALLCVSSMILLLWEIKVNGWRNLK